MIMESIQEVDITSNIGVPKYIKQILTNKKGGIESNTTTVGFLTLHLH